MLEDVHDEDGKAQAKDVGRKAGVEVGVGILLQTDVKAQQQGNEDPWNDDISKSQHGKVVCFEAFLQQILGKHQFYWCLKGLGHCHHHIGAKYPEDIVDEESAQQDAASADIVEVQELYSIKGEGQAKKVVGNPVLPQQVPDANDAAQAQAYQVLGVKFIIDDLFLVFPRTLCEEQLVLSIWKGGRKKTYS